MRRLPFLLCIGYLLLFSLGGPGRFGFLAPGPFFAIGVLLPLLAGLVTETLPPLRRFVPRLLERLDRPSGRRLLWGFGFLALIALFGYKFPPAQWGSVILDDDFTSLYGAALRGLRILKEGSLFGWDPRLLGGYYTVSDINFNLTLFLIPFLPFGAPMGYHLLILTTYLLFPWLVYRVGRTLFQQLPERIFVFLFATLFTASFFRNLLSVGMVDNLIGLDLFLAYLLCLEGAFRRRRLALFWGVTALSFCGLAHLSYFLYAIGWSFLRSLLEADKKAALGRTVAVTAGSILILLPYLSYFLEFRGGFLLDALHFSPHAAPAPSVASESARVIRSALRSGAWLQSGFEGLKGSNYLASSVLSLPILLFLFFTSRRSRGPVMLLGILLACFVLKFPGNLALKRVYFLIPILLCLIWSDWIGIWLRQGSFASCLLLIPIASVTIGPPPLRQVPHVTSLASHFPKLHDTLKRHPDEWVLLETQAVWIRTEKGERPTESLSWHAHPEILLALETGGYLLSNPKDGYHFSIFRGNALMSGVFRGKPIAEIPAGEMESFLKQWGVRSIAVWSRPSKRYFERLPGVRRLWEEDPWAFFEYGKGGGGRVVVRKGEAEIIEERYTRKRIRFKGVPETEAVIVRMNFFPGWKGFFNGKEIPLLNERGQIAFKSPTEGEGEVVLLFETYRSLYAFSLALLLGVFLFSFRRKR